VDATLVSRLMQRSRAQRVVLLLDCCYGGAFERGMIPRAGGDVDVGERFLQDRLDGGRGRAVITASTAMQYAFEGSRLTGGDPAGPSLFTGAVVAGIRTGEADRDQDGQIALGELYEYVYDRVRASAPHQSPCKWEFGLQGGLYLARNPRRRIRPGRLPQELLDLAGYPAAAGRIGAVAELGRLAAGADLSLAAAARLELGRLVDDDSRRVGQAAAEALRRTAIRVTASLIELGPVTVPSGSASRDLAVEGGPLALASAVSTSDPSLRATLEGAALRITWTPTTAGSFTATVTIAGPAGQAEIRVTGTAVAPAPPGPAARAAPAVAAPVQHAQPGPPGWEPPPGPVSGPAQPQPGPPHAGEAAQPLWPSSPAPARPQPLPVQRQAGSRAVPPFPGTGQLPAAGLAAELPPVRPPLVSYLIPALLAGIAVVLSLVLPVSDRAALLAPVVAALVATVWIAVSRDVSRRRRRLLEALIVRDQRRHAPDQQRHSPPFR
jgi:hypothetical protein